MYSSSNIIRQIISRRIRWAGACGKHGRGEKRVQGKMVTRKTGASMGGWDLMDPEAGVEWIQLAQDRYR
jgi:hypothetical protein